MSLSARARIHLPNIVANWRTVRDAGGNSVCAAVVKADAYGHGLGPVSQALHDAGCDHFFVAHAFEGEAVRSQLGSHATIYVLNGPDPYEEPLYRANALTPVINSDHQFQLLVSWLQTGGKLRDGYALHFDTGMNRLGLPAGDASEIAAATADIPPAMIMSHLACSDDKANAMNGFQLAQFHTIAEHFPGIPTSLCNSDGVWIGPAFQHDLLRPGIALYGGGNPPAETELHPGMTLEAPLIQVKSVQAGETVGYGATHRFKTAARIAIAAIGYGDGFPRSASNRGYATIEGQRCPIVGRVSMDLVTIDVSAATKLARPGVFAQFIGPDVPLEEQASLAGTIGYELTTGLTPRVTRIYEE